MRYPSTLGAREAGPQPFRLDYGEPGDRESLARYEADWYRWRAIHRDAEPTNAEREASLQAAIDWLRERS